MLDKLNVLTVNLLLAAGFPYHVRVYAKNPCGCGGYCTTTDFGDQLGMPCVKMYSLCICLTSNIIISLLVHVLNLLQLPLAMYIPSVALHYLATLPIHPLSY